MSLFNAPSSNTGHIGGGENKIIDGQDKYVQATGSLVNMRDAEISALKAINTQHKQKNIFHMYSSSPAISVPVGAAKEARQVQELLTQTNENLKAAYRQDIAMPYLLQKKASQTLYNCYLPLTCL
ncbi:MAG: hypothetical protein K2Q14_01710 [Gammaproteobacteria bacterium]|nr:hypothetical protein [Gammaproteobacteria bacterium]